MDESSETQQEESLNLYKSQLLQVDQAIQAAGQSPDLVQLKSDLQEVIKLTEDSLLEIKKSRLLQSLEVLQPSVDATTGTSSDASSKAIDEEYALFQASLLSEDDKEATKEGSHQSADTHPSAGPSSVVPPAEHAEYDDASDDDDDDDDSQFSTLVGTRCRAPFSHDWGGLHYGNAMIMSVEALKEGRAISEHQVRVIFVNPVHPSMVPCKFFLDGKCRFLDDECHFSHGHLVQVSELLPYKEPDHSKICKGCRCLAKCEDEVWYPGCVTDICDDHLVMVQWDSAKEETAINVEHIIPLDDKSDSESEDDSSSSDEGEGPTHSRSSETSLTTHMDRQEVDDDDDDSAEVALPVYLWKPSQTTEKLGAWETHTKGIGSKLMAKMGYITGQGLGPQGEGRAEPVPILLLPQGKSLDKIMELKEMSGNADLFNAMKKLEKQQKLLERKEAQKEKNKEARENWGVFGFINKKLSATGKKGGKGPSPKNLSQASTSGEGRESTRDLGKRSEKDVNIQIFKTDEEIRSVKRHLSHLRTQLARNESRDRKMAENVRQKIAEQENYLQELKRSSQTLNTHKAHRSAHKKLTVF